MENFSKLFVFSFFAVFFVFSSSCKADDCVCSSGPCCDGCYYKSENVICEAWVEYGCPHGIPSYENSVLEQPFSKYCSGYSDDCSGEISGSFWREASYCDEDCNPNFTPSDYSCGQWIEYGCLWGTSTPKIRAVSQKCNEDALNCATVLSYGNWQSGGDCPNFCDPEATTQPLDPPNGASLDLIENPVVLKWCGLSTAKSYVVRVSEGENIVYENTLSNTEISISQFLYLFKGSTSYEWKIAACFNDGNTKCGKSCGEESPYTSCVEFGPERNFITEAIEISDPVIVSPAPLSYPPPEDPPIVNALDFLKWGSAWWAKSFVYKITTQVFYVVSEGKTTSFPISLESVWSSLSLDSIYLWRVKNCIDEHGEECSSFSPIGDGAFKTTGAKPESISPLSGDENIDIPIKLDWENVPGALSYKYNLSSLGIPISVGSTLSSEAFIDCPEAKTSTGYEWKVKSCADETAEICGAWSDVQTFKTIALSVPSGPQPSDGGVLYTYQRRLSWQAVPGANFYRYVIDYEGTQIVPETIISSNSILVPFENLGAYAWHAQACLDSDCVDHEDYANWTFTYDEPTPPAQFGIVPCNRDSDNPDTPWNEREACEIKHIFLIIKTILDFVMWRAVPMALVVLVIATFVKSYFLMDPASIKPLWKTAGEGYLIIFLAWTTITFILKIFGITEEWWILPF